MRGNSIYLLVVTLLVAGLSQTAHALPDLADGQSSGLETSGISYTFATVDHPSAIGHTSLFGINNNGQMVGTFTPPLGTIPTRGPVAQLIPVPTTYGFVLKAGTFTTVHAPPAQDTVLRAINDLGDIAGYSLDFIGISSGFVDVNGQFIPVSAGAQTKVTGINNLGILVGSYNDTFSAPTHGFFAFGAAGVPITFDYPGAPLSAINGVNNLAAVVGQFTNQTGTFGFLSVAGQFAATGPNVVINGINDHFDFVGTFDAAQQNHGFAYVNGTALLIDIPGATSTIVYGINNAGTMVGTYFDGTGTHGFTATPATGP